ncbi:MAG: ABC transporter permease [Chlamydiales bacterium]
MIHPIDHVRRVKALCVKEFIQIINDPSSFLIAFVLPLMLIILYGAGLSLDANNLKVGIVLEDDTEEARSLAASIQFSQFFDSSIARNRHAVYPKMISGALKGIMVIPFYFTRDLKNPSETASIQVIADGSDPNTANFVQNYIEGAVTNWLNIQRVEQGLPQPPSVTVDPRIWFNEEVDSHYFLVPGSIAIILTLAGTLLTSLVIAKEWERGSMEALMATPVTMQDILVSKFLTYFIMGLGTLCVCYVFARYFFAVPYRGSILWLVITSSAYLSFALGLGILISALTKNQFAATQASLIVSFLPAFMLSGFIFEINSMPTPIQWLSKALPPRYYVQNLQTLFLAGDIPGIIYPNILILLCYGAGVFFVTSLKSKKRLD